MLIRQFISKDNPPMFFRIIAFVSLMCVTPALGVQPAKADSADFEKRLQQQERRIDRLEQAVESLQNRLLDSQYGEAGNPAGIESGRSSY